MLGKSIIAVFIKGSSAALAYGFFLAAAFVTDPVQFGYFGIAWTVHALAYSLGIVGQHAVAMRLWPQWNGLGQRMRANGLLLRCAAVSAGGLVAVAALFFLLALLVAQFEANGQLALLCLATMLLTLLDGWAEVMSGIERARGHVALALLPRDVLSRVLAILVVGALWFADIKATAVSLLLVASIGIAIPVTFQTVFVFWQVLREGFQRPSADDSREHRRVSLGLLGANFLPVLSGQIQTVVVGVLLGPTWAGLYFAADKTSQVLNLVTNGFNQVVVPKVADAFYRGDRDAVQALSNQVTLAGGVISAVLLVAIAVAGSWILSLFDPAYATGVGAVALLLLAVGQTAASLGGGANSVLQMTGHEAALSAILACAGALGLLLLVLLAPLGGVVGAALAACLAMVASNIAMTLYSRRLLRIDPSIFGLVLASKRPRTGVSES